MAIKIRNILVVNSSASGASLPNPGTSVPQTPSDLLPRDKFLATPLEALRAIIGSKSAISLQRGTVNPKFQVEGVAPTNHSPSQKTSEKNFCV